MIDINLIRDNPEMVRENIRRKFQHDRLPLVDEVIELDRLNREAIQRADYLRSQRNAISKQIGGMMQKGQKAEAEEAKQQVKAMQDELAELERKEAEYAEAIREKMMVIPQIMHPPCPWARTTAKMWSWSALASRWCLTLRCPTMWASWSALTGLTWIPPGRPAAPVLLPEGDIARLHSAILSYARDFMIDRGFTYYIPPFMIRSEVVTGVMSFTEMENMMYKIEGGPLPDRHQRALHDRQVH